MSDLMGRRYGMRGRIWVVFIGLALGGARSGLLSNLFFFVTRGQLRRVKGPSLANLLPATLLLNYRLVSVWLELARCCWL